MLVDYESAWHDLKKVINSKKSHGGAALLVEMARCEITHGVTEGLPEKALRLYGEELYQALVPAVSAPEGQADGVNDRGSLDEPLHRSTKEIHHVGEVLGAR